MATPHKKQRARRPKATKWRWQPREIALLGKVPDRDVARAIGRDVKTVARMRQRLGIPSVRPGGFDSTQKHLLGTMRDADLAKRMGCALITIIKWRTKLGIPCFASKSKPWTKADLAMFQSHSDEEIARLQNRDIEKVRRRRHRITTTAKKRWTSKEYSLLGKLSDKQLASKSGRSLNAIRCMRRKKGIPSEERSRKRGNRTA